MGGVGVCGTDGIEESGCCGSDGTGDSGDSGSGVTDGSGDSGSVGLDESGCSVVGGTEDSGVSEDIGGSDSPGSEGDDSGGFVSGGTTDSGGSGSEAMVRMVQYPPFLHLPILHNGPKWMGLLAPTPMSLHLLDYIFQLNPILLHKIGRFHTKPHIFLVAKQNLRPRCSGCFVL